MRTVRRVLCTVLGRIVLHTVIFNVENIVTSRPSFKLSDDVDDDTSPVNKWSRSNKIALFSFSTDLGWKLALARIKNLPRSAWC